jgi:hypothetical protein
MAVFTPTWTTGVSLRAAAAIANGANLTDTINLATSLYYMVDVTVGFDISSGTPSGDLVIEVFQSADGGTTVDTIARVTRRINFTATANKITTIRALGGAFVSLKYTNNTGVTGNVTVKYAGLKQTST